MLYQSTRVILTYLHTIGKIASDISPICFVIQFMEKITY